MRGTLPSGSCLPSSGHLHGTIMTALFSPLIALTLPSLGMEGVQGDVRAELQMISFRASAQSYLRDVSLEWCVGLLHDAALRQPPTFRGLM